LKGSKLYFIAFLLLLDNSLKTRQNLTDKLCIFSTAQGKDKGNINVILNYEKESDCTRVVIHKNEFSFHLSSTFNSSGVVIHGPTCILAFNSLLHLMWLKIEFLIYTED